MKKNLAIFAAASLLAVVAGFAPESAHAETAYQHLTWFFMLAAAIFMMLSLLDLLRQIDLRSWLTRHWPASLLALLIVGCGALLSPPEFRVLADETNLLGVSLEMHENLQTRLQLEAIYFYHGMRNGISYKTEMRPAGYPFALSVLHNLTGYRPANAFALNLFLAWLALMLMYGLVERRGGRRWGVAAMLILAAFPVFVQCAGSAGFEMYNLTLALLLIFLFELFIAGEIAAGPVVASLVLLAFSRYESILAILCVVPPLLFFGESDKSQKGLSNSAIWAFPLLLVPALWLRRLTWNTGSFQVADLEKAFSTDNIWENLAGYWQYFTVSGLTRFAGPIILAIAAVGLLVWFRTLLDSSRSRRERSGEVALAAFFLLHLLARLFYTQGNPMNPYTARLALVLLPALALLAVFALRRLEGFLNRGRSEARSYAAPVAGLAILLLLGSWPMAGGCNGVNSLALFREFKWVRQQLQALGAGDESIIVCSRPVMYVPLKYSAVGPDYAVKNAASLVNMLKISACSRLILVESIYYRDQRSSLPVIPEFAALRSQTLFETQQTGREKLKITILTP